MRKKGTRNSLKPFLVRSVWANWIVRDLLEFYPDPSVWQLSRSSAYFVEDFLNVFQCCRWHFARLVVELGRMVKDKEQIHSKLGLRKILCWFIANLWEFAPTHAYSLGNFDPSNKYTFEGTRLRELETISYLNEFIGFYWFYFWINKDLCEDEFEPFYYTYLHTGSLLRRMGEEHNPNFDLQNKIQRYSIVKCKTPPMFESVDKFNNI